MKIVVLAGGTSTERDVSIVSGTGVCRALRKKQHQAILVDVFFGTEKKPVFEDSYDVDRAAEEIRTRNRELEEAKRTRKSFFGPHVLEICDEADVVFLALHGANGEDGKIQAAFDLLGITYTGTGYLSSAVAMDKGLTKHFFVTNGIPTPMGAVLKADGPDLSMEEMNLEFPVIVKPCCGGSSVGVVIARNEEELKAAKAEAFSYEPDILVEEYVEGREFSVAVIDDKAYPIIEIAPKEGFYDYENKYKAGAVIETCPADLPEDLAKEIQEKAVAAATGMMITGYSRLDVMMRPDGRYYFLEANTLPGMTPTSLMPQEAAAVGISYEDLCEMLVQISLAR